MYWNHRILKRSEYGDENLYMVEVYYDEEQNGILGWTEGPAGVWGEDLDAVRRTLAWMTEALEKPILDEAELLRQAEERGPLTEEEYETYDSVEELLAALDSDSQEDDAQYQETTE